MSSLTDRVAYLKGLAEGMEIEKEGKVGKLLLAMLDVMNESAEAVQLLAEVHEELDEYVESLDDDLSELEEAFFDDEEDDDEDDDDLIECECPHCGNIVFFDADDFDLSDEHICPQCQKPIFEGDDD